MATILPRRRADGTIGHMATIRLHSKKKLVHRETKTFSRRAAAEKWARAREVELEDPAAMVRACAGDVTLASLIRWYIDSFQHISKWQRTKQSQLRFLEKHPIGSLNALSLSAATLIDHVRSRRAKGTGPATVGNDLTWIGVVLRAAKSVKSLPTSPDVVVEARNACRESRLLGKSKRRDRCQPVEVLLPERFRDRHARHRHDCRASANPAHGHRARSVRLLVEDNPGVRTATQLLLVVEGYRVTTAESLAEAARLAAQHPDMQLLVTDYHLTNAETGVQVIAAVRSQLATDVRTVLITGDTSSAVRALQHDEGLRITSKPIDANELLSVLRELLAA